MDDESTSGGLMEEEKVVERMVQKEECQGEMVQEEKVGGKMVLKKKVHEEMVHEEMVQGGEVREEMLQENILLEEMVQEKRVIEDVVQEDKFQEDMVQEKKVLEEMVQENVPEEITQRKKLQVEKMQQDLAWVEKLQGGSVQEEMFQMEMVQGGESQGEMVQDEMVQQRMVQGEMVQDEMVQQEERLLEVTVKEEIVEPESPSELLDCSSSPSHSDSGESVPDIDMAPLSSSPSSCPESEDDAEDPGSGWTARNGQAWFPTNSETQHFVQSPRGAKAGPTRFAMSKYQGLESTFDMFWTDEMINLIVNMTNLQGSRSFKDWTEVDPTDIRAYVGLMVLGGVYRSKGESTASLWDDRSGRPIFRATMALKRFLEINRALSFHDKLQKAARRQTDDKLEPIRSLWEMWAHRLPLLFTPGADVVMDEQHVPFRGRCMFRQYVSKSPAKYGIKVWLTADVASSYAWKCDVNLGEGEGEGAAGAGADRGKRVAVEMTAELRGGTVTCGNFLTSYSLAQELLRGKVALVGMIRKSRPELPPNLLRDRERAVLSSLFAFTRNTTAVSYLPMRGRSVVLISTKHRDAVVTGGPKKKPEIITYYNHCKGVFDNLNKILDTYTCRRRTSRWSQTLFFNMLDISAHNAFILFTALDPSWNNKKNYKRRLFLEELGNSLVSAEILRRQRVPQAPFAAAVVRGIQASASGKAAVKRRRCQLCTNKNKKTNMVCVGCGANTCKDHQVIYCRSCWAI